MMTGYRPIFILLTITILAYLSVDIFYKVINAKLAGVKTGRAITEKAVIPKASRKPSMGSYSVIAKRNLFGSTDKATEEKQINVDELELTKLKLALRGTVSGNGKLDFAVIEETDKKKQGLFRVGDTIAAATVIRIMRGMVALRVGDRDEILKMEEGDTGKKSDVGKPSSLENRIPVKKTDIDKAFKNMNRMLTQVRIRPYFSAGKPDGFMVSRIKHGSIFQKMGLKNGDVIQAVNGQPMGSADEMLNLYKELKSGSEITVGIKRRGRQENLRYVFR